MARSASKSTPGRGSRRKAGASYPEEGPVRKLRDRFGLSQLLMARLLGVSLRTVSRLERDPKARDLPRSLAEMHRLLKALGEIMRPEHVSSWLDEPTEGFAGLKPIEVIERGELDRLWAMIFRVGSGQPI